MMPISDLIRKEEKIEEKKSKAIDYYLNECIHYQMAQIQEMGYKQLYVDKGSQKDLLSLGEEGQSNMGLLEEQIIQGNNSNSNNVNSSPNNSNNQKQIP